MAIILLAATSCHGFQLPEQRTRTAFSPPGRGIIADSSPTLYIGADFDSDFEAALGQAPLSEYERDAEFYRKRNEEYAKSLRKGDKEDVVAEFSMSSASAKEHTTDDTHNPGWVADSVKASENSFRFVEKTTFSLLTEKPMLALAMFAAAGLAVAYLSGFFFLEGYIEDWNPAENDMIPYWDDAEIHTIERALPPEA